jgi:hypothetical protein
MEDAKPEQAPPDAPHWIVMRFPAIRGRRNDPFRHPTQEGAWAEAQRLARKVPGITFRVYASGLSFCIKPDQRPDWVTRALSGEPATESSQTCA